MNQATHSVGTMCRLLKISRSGFYAWLDRPMCERQRIDLMLTGKIAAIHRRSRGTYGSPNIHAELKDDHDVHVGRKRVARLMREAGLRSIVAPNYVVTTTPDGAAAMNEELVKRQFKADGPDQLWVADATYVPTWAGTIYLAMVLDVWSHKIVGWAIEDHLRTELMLDALNMALVQRRPKKVIHHLDHGCQPGFNWSSQRSLRSDLTSKIFIAAVQSDANASEVGAQSGAGSWFGTPAQNFVERFGWRSPAERLSRSAVQRDGNCI